MATRFLLSIVLVVTSLMISGQGCVKNISLQEFDTEVLESSLPVFLQMSASWCPPCKVLQPIFEELSEEFKGRVVFAQIDVMDEKNRDILQNFFWNYKIIVTSFPVLFVFNKGSLVDHFYVRVPNQEELRTQIDLFLENLNSSMT